MTHFLLAQTKLRREHIAPEHTHFPNKKDGSRGDQMLYFFDALDVAVEFCAHQILETKALLKFVHRGTCV